MKTIDSEQIKLLNELYSREGVDAVVAYLVAHQDASLAEAKTAIVSLGFADDSYKYAPRERVVFEHYCLFDDKVFIGPEGSLCEICGTDGYNDTRGIATKAAHYIKGIFNKKELV
jgi:hypothetical protein